MHMVSRHRFAGLSIVLSLFGLFPNPSSANPAIDFPVDPTTAAWVARENANNRVWLEDSNGLYAKIKARNAELAPQNAAVKTDYFGIEFAVVKGSLTMMTATGPRVVVDAQQLPKGAVVSDFRISPDAQKLAYCFQVFGTDWATWYVIDLQNLAPIAGPVYIKASVSDEIAWAPDSNGFYYQAGTLATEDYVGKRRPQIRYHQLGTPATSDVVVFEDQEIPHTARYNVRALDQDRAIVYRVLGGAEVPFSVYLVENARSGHPRARSMVGYNQHWGRFIGLNGTKVLVRTSELGGNYGVLAVDANTGAKSVVVPQAYDRVLAQAQQIGNTLVLQYLDMALNQSVVVTDLFGRVLKTFRPSDAGLQNLSSLSTLSGNYFSTKGYFTVSSAVQPTETVMLDLKSMSFTRIPANGTVPFAANKIATVLTSYQSHDGTMIPIEIYYRTDLGTPPRFAYLYAYGNIGISNSPSFNRKFQLMLDLGGAVALPRVRGGGERGVGWQLAGIRNKWTMLNDVRMAARFLARALPSVTGRIVLSGRSYGGMLTMTAYTHFAEDFAAFTPVVGVSDPASFLFNEQGWWAFDDLGFSRDGYGRIIYSPQALQAIQSWSPMAGIPTMREAKPIFAFSQQYDSRVGSMQTVRFIQTLRQRFGEMAPIRMIEEENGGHNGRAEAADEATFIAKVFGITDFVPVK